MPPSLPQPTSRQPNSYHAPVGAHVAISLASPSLTPTSNHLAIKAINKARKRVGHLSKDKRWWGSCQFEEKKELAEREEKEKKKKRKKKEREKGKREVEKKIEFRSIFPFFWGLSKLENHIIFHSFFVIDDQCCNPCISLMDFHKIFDISWSHFPLECVLHDVNVYI